VLSIRDESVGHGWWWFQFLGDAGILEVTNLSLDELKPEVAVCGDYGNDKTIEVGYIEVVSNWKGFAFCFAMTYYLDGEDL